MMAAKHWRRPNSLVSLATDIVLHQFVSVENINICVKVKELMCLPYAIKTRLLKKIIMSRAFQKNLHFEEILSSLLNEYLCELDLTLVPLNNNILNMLTKCVKLRHLYLTGNVRNDISGNCLNCLFKSLPFLQTLVITNLDEVRNDTLEVLSQYCRLLEVIDITGCSNISDEGLDHLAMMNFITSVKFSNTNVTGAGIAKFAKGPNSVKLKEIRLDGCSNVTDEGLQAIAKYCPNIEILIFNNCNNTSGQKPFEVCSFQNLKQLTWTVPW